MARYQGRVIVKKVGEDGKQITGSLTDWKAKNPGKLTFDSMPEYQVWKYITDSGLKYEYQPNIELFDKVATKEFEKGEIKDVNQRKIGYTPDFYLPDYDCYIEVKGYADELFKLRWKLFKLKAYTGFIVYSLEEAVELLELLKSVTKKEDTTSA